jgi:hypothetical protein
MDPETPSRRKKTGDEPVTIDLEAAPASVSNEALAASDTTDGDAVTAGTAPTDTPVSEPVQDEAATADAFDEGDRPEPVEPARATYEEPASPSYEEQPRPAYEEQPRHETTAPPRQSNAGALAASILGGLIALIGAGSLQYGGYLPALGPERSGDSGAVAALSNEVEALKTRLSEAPPGNAADLQPIETRLAALEKTAGEGSTAAADPQALTKVQDDVARMATELAALREAIARTTEAVSTTEGTLTERIAAAEQKLEEPRSDVTVARAVAASALKTAIDRGGPYLAELEALASISPDDPAVAGLREHAAVGAPSRADMVRDFQDTADQILDAVHQPEGEQGIFNRLVSSAASAVRVRPVGSVEGDTPEAVVARIETKLQNGDFKGAQIEWKTLPESGQAAAAEYKRTLDRRVTIEDMIGGVVSGAMTGTAKQG